MRSITSRLLAILALTHLAASCGDDDPSTSDTDSTTTTSADTTTPDTTSSTTDTTTLTDSMTLTDTTSTSDATTSTTEMTADTTTETTTLSETTTADVEVVEPPTPPSGFVAAPAGTFVMGSPDSEPGRVAATEVQHTVTLTRAFWIQTHEVTLGDWQALMGNTPPSSPTCTTCPVVQVGWWDALTYANARSDAEDLARCYTLEGCTGSAGVDLACTDVTIEAVGESPYACTGYRLPTAAEWEYAYRAGTTTALYNGALAASTGCVADATAAAIAWYCDNSDDLQPVGLKAANAWGLYDMAGNAWEWVGERVWTATADAATDPFGPDSGANRIIRGGSYGSETTWLRAAARDIQWSNQPAPSVGFRLARTVP